jgi:hypothetical protein
MKIGRRTQAYAVGFLIGVAIVSVLLDSRRDRALERSTPTFTWQRIPASLEELPEPIRERSGAQGYITGVQQLDAAGEPTGWTGYFFADASGQRFWYLGHGPEWELYDGTRLTATSHPGIEWELMQAGFEHQGHQVLSDASRAPDYLLAIDVHSAVEMVDAVENLRSKTHYIASVAWVPWQAEGAAD